MRWLESVWLAAFALFVLPASGALGQEASDGSATQEAAVTVSAPWSDNIYPLMLDEDLRLGGEGAAWLKNRAKRSQFVLFGEQHYVDGLPLVVAATHDALYDDGFRYLVLETGPWFSGHLSEGPVDTVLDLYPYSLAFSSDDEIAMLRAVEARSAEQADVFWGIDQEITAIHPFQRLTEIAPDAETRRMARGLFLKSALKGGEYLRQDYAADLAALDAAIGEAGDEETRQILDALAISQQIFVDWRSGNRGDQPMSISVEAREQYMKDLLDAKLAEHKQGEPVRAIVKMGGAHIIEGIGPNGVETLGAHAERIARRNGMEALHIGIRAYDSGQSDWLPAEAFAQGDTILIDTRRVMAYLPEEALGGLPEALVRDLSGFDALIYLKDAGADTQSVMRPREAAFRRQLLERLGLALVPLAILLTGIWMPLRFVGRLFGGRLEKARPVLPGLFLFAATLGTLALGAWQLSLFFKPASAAPAVLTGGLLSAPYLPAACLAAVIGVVLAAAGLIKGWWGVVARLYFILIALALTGLAAFLWYWNIGGMMGGG